VRKAFLFAIFAVTVAARAATITFVSPLSGAQVIGPAALEITTDAPVVERVDFFVDGVLAGVARKAPYRIAFDFGTSLAPRTITAKVWSAGFKTSETASVTTATLTAGDTLNIDLVEVPLRILASVRSSRPLRPADLRVRENGIEQTIRDVKVERPPAHFAFVVDRSLSMNGGKLQAALRAIETELRQLRAGDTASLVVFNHHVAKARPIAAGRPLTTNDLVPSGGTSLRDALASVASSERTYAIVITDGGDRTSQLSDDAVLRKISGTKTVVNAIVLGDTHTRFLDRAASNTGGTVVPATKSSVTTALSRLLNDINSRYLVIYQSKSTTPGWRSIDVQPRRAGVTIASARKGYYAE
jgi:von Willebrand factor type A domain/Bacterial Ig domain